MRKMLRRSAKRLTFMRPQKMTLEHYLPAAIHHALVGTLENLAKEGPRPGMDLRSEFALALGEIADIWPDSIREPVPSSLEDLRAALYVRDILELPSDEFDALMGSEGAS